MATFEEVIEAACANQEIAGAVCMASDTTGMLQYAKPFGSSSIQKSFPLTLDSTFWIASCTKLLTAVAVLQTVQEGLISLDEDVSRVVPEIMSLEILKGFDETSGAPILVKNTKSFNLRLLLSHSSGISYESMHPLLRKYKQVVQAKDSTSQTPKDAVNLYSVPLCFEPGTAWTYGAGLDWAGKIVERLHNMTLADYFQKYILEPLGINDITFHPEKDDDFMSRLVETSRRDSPLEPRIGHALDPDAKIIPSKLSWPIPIKTHFGGSGLFGSAPAFMRVLESLCKDDGVLLDSSSVELLFTPQLAAAPHAYLNRLMKDPGINSMMGPSPPGMRLDWSFAGLLFLDDAPAVAGSPAYRAHTTMWSGLPNIWWWMDRSVGLYGIYASQLMPPGDPKSVALNAKFRTAMYERLQRAKM